MPRKKRSPLMAVNCPECGYEVCMSLDELERNEDESGVSQGFSQFVGREIVEDSDFVTGVEQPVHQVRPDKAGAAGDENAHQYPASWK